MTRNGELPVSGTVAVLVGAVVIVGAASVVGPAVFDTTSGGPHPWVITAERVNLSHPDYRSVDAVSADAVPDPVQQAIIQAQSTDGGEGAVKVSESAFYTAVQRFYSSVYGKETPDDDATYMPHFIQYRGSAYKVYFRVRTE